MSVNHLSDLFTVLDTLRSRMPEDTRLQQLAYAAADADEIPGARAIRLRSLLGHAVVPDDIAARLRTDRDPSVRAAAWTKTTSSVEEVRTMLAVETHEEVRLAVAGHPDLPDADRLALVCPLTARAAAAVVANHDRFELDVVLEALAFGWGKTRNELTDAERDAFENLLVDPAIAAAVTDRDDLPLFVRIVAAGGLPAGTRLETLTRLHAEASGRLYPSKGAAQWMVAGLGWLMGHASVTPEEFEAAAALADLVKHNQETFISSARERANMTPRDRARSYLLPAARVYAESLTDPTARTEAAAAVLFNIKRREWAQTEAAGRDEDMFDVFSPFLTDASPAALLALADAHEDAVPGRWMLRFPEVLARVASGNAIECLEVMDWEELRGPDASATRSLIVSAYVNREAKLQTTVLKTMIERGWMTEAHVAELAAAVPSRRLLSLVAPLLHSMDKVGLDPAVLAEAFTGLAGNDVAETSLRVQAYLSVVPGTKASALDAVGAVVAATS